MPILSVYKNNLRVRGQIKPRGIPRIDWSHTLAKDLVYYAWEDGGTVVNLANPVYQYTYTTPASRASTYGTGLYGTGSGGSQAAYNDVGSAMPRMYNAFCTIAAGFYRQGTSAQYGGPMGQSANGGTGLPYNNISILLNPGGADSSQFSIAYAVAGPNQNVTTAVGGVTDNAFHVISFHAEAGGTHKWLDGVDVAGSVVVYLPFTTGDSSIQFGSTSFAGFTFFNAKWNRILSAEEQRTLYRDPYQFLIPAEAYMPALQIVSGPSFKSAWARNSNTILKGRQL